MTKDYPSDWNTRRKKVYKRDNFTCQNCGREGGPRGTAELHAHHIVPKSSGGSHQLNNLQTLCSDCHKAIHGDSMAPTGQSQPDTNLTEMKFLPWLLSLLPNNMKYCPICEASNFDFYLYDDNEESFNLLTCTSCSSVFKNENQYTLIDGDREFLINQIGEDVLKKIYNMEISAHSWKIFRENKTDDININKLIEESQAKFESQKYVNLLILLTFMTGIPLTLALFLQNWTVYVALMVYLVFLLLVKWLYPMVTVDKKDVLKTTD